MSQYTASSQLSNCNGVIQPQPCCSSIQKMIPNADDPEDGILPLKLFSIHFAVMPSKICYSEMLEMRKTKSLQRQLI